MLKTIKILIAIFLCSSIMPFSVYSQKSSNEIVNAIKDFYKKDQKKEYLTLPLLKSATQFKYGFNNGSVAPEYQYQGYIIVTSSIVTLRIYNMSSVCYTKSRSITSAQYSTFINDFYRLGVKPNPDEPLMLCGGAVYDILILKNNSIMFKGIEDEDIVTTKGRLSDAFAPLLSSDMKQLYDDPTKIFDPLNNSIQEFDIEYLH